MKKFVLLISGVLFGIAVLANASTLDTKTISAIFNPSKSANGHTALLVYGGQDISRIAMSNVNNNESSVNELRVVG